MLLSSGFIHSFASNDAPSLTRRLKTQLDVSFSDSKYLDSMTPLVILIMTMTVLTFYTTTLKQMRVYYAGFHRRDLLKCDIKACRCKKFSKVYSIWILLFVLAFLINEQPVAALPMAPSRSIRNRPAPNPARKPGTAPLEPTPKKPLTEQREPASTPLKPLLEPGKPASTPVKPQSRPAKPASATPRISPKHPAGGKPIPPKPIGKPANQHFPKSPAPPKKPSVPLGKPASTPIKPLLEPGKPASNHKKPLLPLGKPASTPIKPPLEPGNPASTPKKPFVTLGKPASTPLKPLLEPGKPASTPKKPLVPLGKPASTPIKPLTAPGKPPSSVATLLSLILTTDSFPLQTSWSLVNTNTRRGLRSLSSVVAERPLGFYVTPNTTYSEYLNLFAGIYEFVIYDTACNGLCCNYGYGSYTLKVNEILLGAGGGFGCYQSTTIHISNESGKTPSQKPSKKPLKKPSKKPSKQTSKEPSQTPRKKPSQKASKNPSQKPRKKPSEKPSKKPMQRPSKAPSRTPRKKPSQKASKNPSQKTRKKPSEKPSKKPSRTHSKKPSRKPRKVPLCESCAPKTVTFTKQDWSIVLKNMSTTVSITMHDKNSWYFLNFTTGKHVTFFSIYSSDCVTDVTPYGVLSFGSPEIASSGGSQDVAYPYQFNITGLAGSNIYTRTSSDAPQASLVFCARLDLLDDTNQSVSFLNAVVNITLDMIKHVNTTIDNIAVNVTTLATSQENFAKLQVTVGESNTWIFFNVVGAATAFALLAFLTRYPRRNDY